MKLDKDQLKLVVEVAFSLKSEKLATLFGLTINNVLAKGSEAEKLTLDINPLTGALIFGDGSMVNTIEEFFNGKHGIPSVTLFSTQFTPISDDERFITEALITELFQTALDRLCLL